MSNEKTKVCFLKSHTKYFDPLIKSMKDSWVKPYLIELRGMKRAEKSMESETISQIQNIQGILSPKLRYIFLILRVFQELLFALPGIIRIRPKILVSDSVNAISLIYFFSKRLLGTKNVVVIPGIYSEEIDFNLNVEGVRFKWLCKLFYRFTAWITVACSDRFIVADRKDKSMLMDMGVDPKNIILLYYPPVDPKEFKRDHKLKKMDSIGERPCIAFVATNAEEDAIKESEEIVKKVKKDIPEIRALMIGHPFNYLKERMRGDSSFICLGQIPHSDMKKYLQMTDMVVFPYNPKLLQVGTGAVPLEAALLEVPSISTNYGDIDKIVINDFTGYLIEKTERNEIIGEISRTIIKMLKNDKKRRAMGANARKLVTENFSLNNLRGEYLNIFKKLS